MSDELIRKSEAFCKDYNTNDNPELRCENAEKRLLEGYGIKER